jgi:hypothetical protein
MFLLGVTPADNVECVKQIKCLVAVLQYCFSVLVVVKSSGATVATDQL